MLASQSLQGLAPAHPVVHKKRPRPALLLRRAQSVAPPVTSPWGKLTRCRSLNVGTAFGPSLWLSLLPTPGRDCSWGRWHGFVLLGLYKNWLLPLGKVDLMCHGRLWRDFFIFACARSARRPVRNSPGWSWCGIGFRRGAKNSDQSLGKVDCFHVNTLPAWYNRDVRTKRESHDWEPDNQPWQQP